MSYQRPPRNRGRTTPRHPRQGPVKEANPTTKLNRSPYSSTDKKSTHSVRVSNSTWKRAKQRVEKEEGITMSSAVALLIGGYAEGMVSLPTSRTVYGEHIRPDDSDKN